MTELVVDFAALDAAVADLAASLAREAIVGENVQLFLGPRGVAEDQVIADVESVTGLRLRPATAPADGDRGSDDTRGVLLVPATGYEDEPHLPFSEHPFELEFYTVERTIESDTRFLSETFRRLRDLGRYTLFATKDVHVRIDPE